MSAYVVSHEHLDALVAFGLSSMPRNHGPMRWTDEPISRDEGWDYGEHVRQLTHDRDDEVWMMLLAENIRSVEYRYPDCADSADLPGPVELDVTRGYRPCWGGTPEPVAVLKAINCYEYQACEHPGWLTSEARQFCDALRDLAIRCLPGYEEASWEISA